MPLNLFHRRQRALLVGSIVVGLLCAAALVHGDAQEDAARAAITAAVRAKLGSAAAHADVRVDNLQVRGDLSPALVAVVPPNARTGVQTRFALRSAEAGGTQVGEAEATILVSAPHVRAIRPLHRGAALDTSAVSGQAGDVGSIPLQALANGQTLGGAVAAREIAKGDVLIASLVTMPNLVRTGDRVVVRAAAGAVYVQAVVVAAQPGSLGEIIRCVNPDTRKAMAARIVAPGLAEVVHAY